MDHTKLTQPDKAIKIALLGYGSSGKTYFLGSLKSLQYQPVRNAFSVRDKDAKKNPRLEEIYNIINNTHNGVIFRTTDHEDIDLIFHQGGKALFDITITDSEGQALEPKFKVTDPSRRIEQAIKLSDRMPEYHGVLILIKSPNSEIEFVEKQDELLRLMDFVRDLKDSDPLTPIALVFTQIDRLKEFTGAKNHIQAETKKSTDAYVSQNPKSSAEQRKEYETEMKRQFTNQEILRLFPNKSKYFHQFITTFLTNMHYPNVDDKVNLLKVFPASVFGFDNSKENPNDTNVEASKRTMVAKGEIKPYGVRAAFLWMIYKIIELNKNNLDLFVPNFDFDEELIRDTISNIYLLGEAFSSNDIEEFGYDGLFDYINL